MSEKVLITGLGVVSPIGVNLETYWKSLLFSRNYPVPSHLAHSKHIRNRSYYHVQDWKQQITEIANCCVGRASAFAIQAAKMSLEDAALTNCSADSLIGVSIGTAMGDVDLMEQSREMSFEIGGLETFNFKVASTLGQIFGFTGINLSVSTACSAGAYSLSLAVEAIQSGLAEVMIVGGSDAYSRVVLGCFNRLDALDPVICRPFDAERRGTLLSEGAAVLVLESESHARRRHCKKSYAEVKGYGWSCDAYHPTAPDPSAQQPIVAVSRALEDAKLYPKDIDCIVPHATGTLLNDVMECKLIHKVFGADTDRISICSIKSHLGHTGGAAAAFSCLTAAMVCNTSLVPPITNLGKLDPECNLNFHFGEALERKIRNVLINSYAFGGNNISVILGQVNEK